MGWEKAIDLYGKGKCGQYGDNKAEKPWFGDVVGTTKWEAWEKYKGTPKTLCQKMFLEQGQASMMKHGFSNKIPDPKRPGPKYYSECKQFSWVDTLIEKHKSHLTASNGEDVYAITYTAEELAIMQKLKEKDGASHLVALGLTGILTLVSLV